MAVNIEEKEYLTYQKREAISRIVRQPHLYFEKGAIDTYEEVAISRSLVMMNKRIKKNYIKKL